MGVVRGRGASPPDLNDNLTGRNSPCYKGFFAGGRLMKNPLDTITGTVIAGFVLTLVLYVIVKALV
jgi:hypothetical protein